MKKNLIVALSCVIAISSVTASLAMPGRVGKPKEAPTTSAAPAGSAVPATPAASVDEKTATTAGDPSVPPAELLTGKVLQAMDSGGYTYVYIQKENADKVWVAVGATPVAIGTKVSFRGGMEMTNFESKSLKRTFEKIVFADAVVADTSHKDVSPASPLSKDNKGVSGGSKAATSVKDAKISVAKATGANAYTVQEVFEKSAKLNKKKVVVRGKVVKVSVGIMGRNWIHIQDGTGSQAKKNHNLVCTSDGMADVDDIVTVSGTLAKDKDFGGGYKYSAIVEGSTFKK